MRSRRLIVAVATAALMAVASSAAAWYTDSASVPDNTFSTAVLQPPADPTGTGACHTTLTGKITLSWTNTPSTFATGYDVYRSKTSGGPYGKVAFVSGRLTLSYVDGNLELNTTYHYRLRSVAGNWNSAESKQASAKTPLLCV